VPGYVRGDRRQDGGTSPAMGSAVHRRHSGVERSPRGRRWYLPDYPGGIGGQRRGQKVGKKRAGFARLLEAELMKEGEFMVVR